MRATLNPLFFPGKPALAAVLVMAAAFAVACGGDDIESQDIVDDAADGTFIDADDDTAQPDAVATDQGVDTADVTGDAGDAIADAVEDPMDVLFPGIRAECRPPDLGCVANAECGDTGTCIAGGCEPAVAPADYDFGIVRVVSGVRLPAPNSGSGFDMTGDGVPDNVLADTIGVYQGGTELVNDTISQYMNAGLYTYIAAFRGVPSDGCGPLKIAIMPATGDLDMNGLPDGTGEYQVLPAGFRKDGHGPLAQINVAAMDGDLILTGPGESLSLKLPLPDGTILDIPVEGLRIRANVDLTGASAARAETVEAEVGGYVRMSSIVDEVNNQAGGCACAGVQAGTDPAELVFDAGTLTARCVQSFDDNDCSEATDGKVCSNLTSTCTALLVMNTLVDVASGKTKNDAGTAVKDALSLSIYVNLAPATLAEPPLAPDFGAIPDSWRNIPEADIAQDTLPVRLGVLINDYCDTAATPIITGVTQGDAGGSVAVGADGMHIVYTPQSGFYGFDHFTYTIQDASANTATAGVEVRVSTFGALGCESDTWDYCVQYCRHEATCSPDTFGSLADPEACADNCMGGVGMLMDVSSDCGRPYACMEMCRVTLPCTMTDEYYEAVATLGQGGELTDKMPCGGWIQSSRQQCGECAPGTFGATCQACPQTEGLICNGIAECDDGVDGTGECICGEGMSYVDGDCQDIDECLIGPPVCGDTGWCVNYWGEYACFCQDGQAFDPVSGHCIEPISACDPNPCLQDVFSQDAVCTPDGQFAVGYACDCLNGYQWDGDFGACRWPTDNCIPNLCERDPHSTGACSDMGTEGFMCGCDNLSGYFWNWNESACVDPCDILDCTQDPHSTGACSVPSMTGVPECGCSEGYYFNYSFERCWDPSLPCDIQPCSSIDHAIADSCVQTAWATFTCGCDDGWQWDTTVMLCTEEPANE